MSITPTQAATRLVYALIPIATLITLKAQVKRADTTITRVEEILLESETELKEAKEGTHVWSGASSPWKNLQLFI